MSRITQGAHSNPLGVLSAETLSRSPSLLRISPAEETKRLRRGVSLLRSAGASLELSQETIVAAIEFFLRFFVFQSLATYSPDDIAMASMFLACKTEEQPCKPRDVINVFHAILRPDAPVVPLGNPYWNLKTKLVALEHLILRTMAFRTQVARPHRLLLNFSFVLDASSDTVQVALALLNDAYFSPALCLTTAPGVLACAALHLAMELLRTRDALPPREMLWWEPFGVTTADLEATCHLMLSTVGGTLKMAGPVDNAQSVIRVHASAAPTSSTHGAAAPAKRSNSAPSAAVRRAAVEGGASTSNAGAGGGSGSGAGLHSGHDEGRGDKSQ